MPHIRLTISNPNNTTYKTIILRKFFNMVFISEDGKKLSIYTATVFSGMGDYQKSADQNVEPCYLKGTACELRFSYESDKKSIHSVIFEDLTPSLWEQGDCIKQVWGEDGDCEKLTNQNDVENTLKRLYPSLDIQAITMPNWNIYHIFEGDKPSHNFVATRGEYTDSSNKGKYGYSLKADPHSACNGMEYMNWIKTEITLSESILGKCTQFELVLEHGEEEVFYTPDFTWYFAPPNGYCLDDKMEKVEIGDQRILNALQPVSDITTVNFNEWQRKELIGERKKFRANIKEKVTADKRMLSNAGKLKISFLISNPQKSGNKQFFSGLLVAFLLAFCGDKTRMNDFYECIKQGCNCTGCQCNLWCNLLSLIFPIVVIIAYMSFAFKLKQCVPVKKGRRYYCFHFFKTIGLGGTLALVLYSFGAWMVVPLWMRSFVGTCANNWRWIALLIAVSVVFNLIYVIYCIAFRKRNLFDNL